MRNFIFESLIVIFGALPQSEKTLTEPHLNVYRRYICCLIRISLTCCLANNDASKIKCERILETIFEPLNRQIKNGDFAKPGGYISLQAAFAKVRTEYFLFSSEREEMGPMISEVLLDFTQIKVSRLLSWWVQVCACRVVHCKSVINKRRLLHLLKTFCYFSSSNQSKREFFWLTRGFLRRKRSSRNLKLRGSSRCKTLSLSIIHLSKSVAHI